MKSKIDFVILLSNIGFYSDRLFAEKIKGIDLIVDGHSHTIVEKPLLVGQTIISQAWEHGKALGILELNVEKGKIIRFYGYLKEISPESESEEPSLKALFKKCSLRVNSLLNQKIGGALIDLNGENFSKLYSRDNKRNSRCRSCHN